MKTKRIISLLLIASLLTSASACGSEAPEKDNGTDTTAEETTEKPEYEFPELNCGGDKFTILNTGWVWSMYTFIDFETQTGDSLDDAVYERDRKIEEIFNVKLDVREAAIDDLADLVRTSVMAGDQAYDAAYIKGDHMSGIITDGCVLDLANVDGLNLDKLWWNQNVRNSCKLGKDGALYFAVSDLSLTAFDLTWCLMFNETKMEELNMDKPYDLVRNGKWTLDKFHEYTTKGANLNGDENFSFKVDGNCDYGFTSYSNVVAMAMVGADCHLTENNADGVPELSAENDRFYRFCDKFSSLTKTRGEYLEANNGDKHYEKIFKSGRALFVGAEIKATSVFRDFDDQFGIVPSPKLDEEQAEYASWINYLVPLLTIPADCKDPERSGKIIDAMSYLSMKNILPLYYNVKVSQKGLRNDDSIEMLGIIRDARYFEPSLVYGWTTNLYNSLSGQLVTGNGNVASLIASNKNKIAEKIAATMELVK
ncbi:MAG: hypothetical protein ACLR5G_08595 [Eubacteriales bacterium]